MEQNKPIMRYTPINTADNSSIHETLVYAVLENIMMQQEEQKENSDHGYYHDHFAFMESLDHVVADQLAAIRNDKISITELTTRINRWFVFCDAIANLGVSCIYNKRNADNNDYAKMFGGLRINAAFISTYLKPKGITVEFRHKSTEARENFPWLAMPCLIIVDNANTEHKVAITPTTSASVWWLDILTSFHNTYNWDMDPTRIGIDENGKMVVDMSHDHHVDSPFADDDMTPTDVTYGDESSTSTVAKAVVSETGESLPVTEREEETFKAIPETKATPPEYKHSEYGENGTKRDNEKHYFATNQDSVSELATEQKGDSGVSPFFNGLTGQRYNPSKDVMDANAAKSSEMLELELNPQTPKPRVTLWQRLGKLRNEFTLWFINLMSGKSK